MRTLLHLILFIPLLASAQAADAPKPSRELVFDVVDQKTAQPIDAISPANLQVKLDKQPVPVLSLQRTHIHPKVAILMDVSGSMLPATGSTVKWNAAWDLIFEVISRLTPEAEFSLYTFNETVTFQVSSVAGTPTVLNRINELRGSKKLAEKRTSILDSAIQVIGTQHLGRHDAVLIITDGGDNHSRAKESDLKKLTVQAGVRLFGCALYDDEPMTPEERMGPVELELLANSAGGAVASFVTRADLQNRKLINAAIASIVSSILNPYVAQLDLAPSAQGSLKLDLTNQPGSKRKGIQIYKPARLAPLDRSK